jgi:hypothetical protein
LPAAREDIACRKMGEHHLMELSNLFGIPAHPLLVHAVVVLVPLTAIGAVISVLLPTMRARIGWIVALGAVANIILVPLVAGSGESLEERVQETALLEKHTEMGEQLFPWVILLAIAFVLFMLLHRSKAGRSGNGSSDKTANKTLSAPWVATVLAVVTIVGAVGATVQVARIGHSGAEATWSDVGAGTGEQESD